MLALSIRQPWADLILFGHKDIENRSWRASDQDIGTRIYIHAGLKVERSDAWLDTAYESLYRASLKRTGAVLGEVDLVGCVEASDSEWFEGPFGFILHNPVVYSKPIMCKGRLGFFRPESFHEKAKDDA